MMWLLSQGSNVKVLEPQSLKEIKSRLRVEAKIDKETGVYKKAYGKELLQDEFDIAVKDEKN